MNFYEQIKKDIISSLRENKIFRNLDFLENLQEINPNNYNLTRAIGVVALLDLSKVKNESFCQDFEVTQIVSIQYHIKPDVPLTDWESRLNVVQAEIIYTLEKAQREGTLFSFPDDIEFTFKRAAVGELKKQEIKEQIFSKCTIVQYEIKYDLRRVIEHEQI